MSPKGKPSTTGYEVLAKLRRQARRPYGKAMLFEPWTWLRQLRSAVRRGDAAVASLTGSLCGTLRRVVPASGEICRLADSELARALLLCFFAFALRSGNIVPVRQVVLAHLELFAWHGTTQVDFHALSGYLIA